MCVSWNGCGGAVGMVSGAASEWLGKKEGGYTFHSTWTHFLFEGKIDKREKKRS